MAGRASLPKDIAALYLLVRLDVSLVQMAIQSPPIDCVLDDYAVTTFAACEDVDDGPICRSDHRIARGDVEVDPSMRCRSLPGLYPTPIAVVRQDPGGAFCRAPDQHNRAEQGDCERIESPSARVFASVVSGESLVVALPTHRYGDSPDASP